MPDPSNTAPSLDDLRREIDALDAEIHDLLVRRGSIIDAITAAKRQREGGAFRPDREADMMRRLVARHRGALPLTTIEHLWREIISTFTQLQSPYTLHLAPDGEALALSDIARFYFGFATPITQHGSVARVVEAVAGSRNDLGLVLLDQADGRWWTGLGPEVCVMARLPFLRLANREAASPALVLSRPLPSIRPYEWEILVVEGEVPSALPQRAEILAQRVSDLRSEVLLALPREDTEAFLSETRGSAVTIVRAGGYFAPIDCDARPADPGHE